MADPMKVAFIFNFFDHDGTRKYSPRGLGYRTRGREEPDGLGGGDWRILWRGEECGLVLVYRDSHSERGGEKIAPIAEQVALPPVGRSAAALRKKATRLGGFFLGSARMGRSLSV